MVICEGLRREFEGRGIAPSKITVIPNAVDIEEFPVSESRDPQVRRDLGLDGAAVLGFLGSFYAYEGLDLLLRALALLRPSRPELRALLVGEGYQYEALQRLANELRLGDAVVFTGRVPHSQVQRYYDQVDLLVYPRHSMRLTELVTPLKPLEAMAQGKVLLASDVGGHRELIRDGDTGFMFRAGDVDALAQAINGALSRRGEWDAMRARARRFVESQRTWAMSVARYAPVYERLVGGGRAGSPARVAGG
jgi:PEP-CTERM/exosortase A-associated glycosyltransferase